MIVLDTTVLSDLMHSQTQARVVDWLDRQPAESIWRTALNVCGQRKALGVKTVSPKRSAALKWTVFKVISTSARPFKAVSSTISKEPGRGRCARSRRSPPRRSDRCAPTRVVPPGVRQGLARCCRPLVESGYAFAATTVTDHAGYRSLQACQRHLGTLMLVSADGFAPRQATARVALWRVARVLPGVRGRIEPDIESTR